MKSELRRSALVAGLALVSLTVGCNLQAGADAAAESTSATPCAGSDAPLAAFRSDLLELAFETATAIPTDPHIKDRSRAQEAVVAACIELHQPQRALGYIERINDWRRGAAYADLAFYSAQVAAPGATDTDAVRHYLDLAGEISEKAEDWRRDRIRVKIARTHAWLGQTQEAAQFEAGVVDSELGKVDAVRAMLIDEDAFDEQIRALDGVIATGNLDLVKNALEACVQLFNRFYADKEGRSVVEEKIKAASKKLPVMIQIELMTQLTEFALNHKDQGKALELVNETQLIVESYKWTAEYHVPVIAKLAGLRHLAGDAKRARSDGDAALALFDAERAEIVSIFRADALRPLAEAYQSMGDAAAALAVYRKAVQEGAENPNSRPRAEDLAATCRSMALHGVEPDAELWTCIRQIRGGLGQPW